MPFWAPDGRAIGFFAGGRLKALTLENGSVADLAAAPSPRGGVWHPNGDIIFAPDDRSGLMRRRGAEGRDRDADNTGRGGRRAESPLTRRSSIGGRSVVWFVRASEGSRQGIWIATLDRPDARKRLAGSDANAIASGNTLIFASGGSLVAQEVDAQTQSLVGQPTLVGSPAGISANQQLLAALNPDLLLFGEPSTGLRELRWVDRSGAADWPRRRIFARVGPSHRADRHARRSGGDRPAAQHTRHLDLRRRSAVATPHLASHRCGRVACVVARQLAAGVGQRAAHGDDARRDGGAAG